LLRLTGDAKYANDIELATYNSLIGAQGADDSWWSHYNNMSGERKPAPEQCRIHMNCCVANGPRALFLLPKIAYMTSKNTVIINLYENGKAKLPLANSGVEITMSAPDYINNYGAVATISGLKNSTQKFNLKLRIPEWSNGYTLTINGEEIKASEIRKGTIRITRTWSDGDKVVLSLNATVRSSRWYDSAAVIERGPLVYALKMEENWEKRYCEGEDKEKYGE
jgi:DUF1680 family protein